MGRLNQRQGFLVSAIAHLAILMAVATHPPSPPIPIQPEVQAPAEPPRAALVLPDRELLRELRRQQSLPPRPAPTPRPAPDLRDRISIGPPSEVRQKQLILRRDEDLVMPKGTGSAPPPAAPPPAPAARPAIRETAEQPSIASSLKRLEQRLQAPGTPSGVDRQMGGLLFDPQGADFTAWANHFKNEVYRNWILPQTALMGFGGHVDFEFQVGRDGTITNVTMLKSSGTRSLDRAAQNALLGSRLLPLPADFGPPQLTAQITFYYGRVPQGS